MSKARRDDLPPLSANAMAAIIERRSRDWGWDEKYRSAVVGKLTRGSQNISPLEPTAAAAIIDRCREGWGWYNALKQSKVTQRQYYAWIAKSHSDEPDAEPYRGFRTQLREAYEQWSARTRKTDEKSLRYLGLA